VVFGPTDGGICEFSLTDPKVHGDLNVTPWVVTSEGFAAFAGVPEGSEGLRYPAVFNRYVVPCVDVGTLASLRYWVAAFGHNHTVNQVWINGVDAVQAFGSQFNWETAELFDAYGVPFTMIKFTGYYPFDGSETVHADVTVGDTGTDLYSIMKYLIRSYTTMGNASLNEEMFALAEAKTGKLTMRALINGSSEQEAAQTLSWLESEVLASFPMISMGWGMGGYGPIATDRRSSLVRAKLEADVFPLMDRISDLQETPKNDLFNDFTLRYSYDIIENRFEGVVTRHADNNVICNISRDQIGERHASPIDSIFIFDDGVANYVIDWLVDHFALPGYYVEYQAWPWVFLFLRRGDNVTITDSEFGWDEVPATVERIAFSRGTVLLGLRVWWTYLQLGGAATTGGG
jgi:hypothetical protein